ncbi:nitrilase-related carbon-nitrogen hydrolase [Acanthopleuribacter pedis]|uniref:CN hydrolase domain-containing protein n=1 Tax=Acanthopleuribacter pedis TaxID=442870 RepID=A0A8J7U409_9BACT|nr:nitrilase-related carbon-nitrogen hydrolase [Acanthopleuribacter pedis]MBO1320162.1 hypothetical protein [Acanthopleuribacter pedis]
MVRIGLLQFDIAWENPAGNVAKVTDLVRTGLQAQGSPKLDLLVLPELWICGFTMNLEAYKTFDAGHEAMKTLAREHDCAVLGGLPHQVEGGQQNRCYLVEGDQSTAYAKIKTFTFAGEHKKYQRGSESLRLPVAGFQLSPFVCYDLRFPELPRAMVPETNIISYVANWPAVRVHHWRSLLIARAIENLSYVIGVNRVGRDGAGLDYNGQSLLIGPRGDIVLDCGDQEGLFLAEIDPQEVRETRATWPFLNDK